MVAAALLDRLRHGALRAQIAFVAGVVAVGGVLRVNGPHIPGLSCPFRAVTGVDCPGCGSTRAMAALTRGQFAAAANFNIMAVFGVTAIAAHVALLGRGGLLNRRRTPAVTLVLVLLFWAARLTSTPLGLWLASTPQ